MSLVFCSYFNVIRVTLIASHLQTTYGNKNIDKHKFLMPQDMSLTENSNQAFFLVLGNMIHSYM